MTTPKTSHNGTALPPRTRRYIRIEQPHYHMPPLRLVHAYFYDIWSLIQEARIPLIGFFILTSINVVYLTRFYDHPACTRFPPNTPQACFTVPYAIFETMRMYVFEINIAWINNNLFGQALLFITPLLGVALLFQSVLDFSRHLLDKSSRREAWQIALARTFHNHIIICGLGRVSYRIILELVEHGYSVVVVEQNWHNEFVAKTLKMGVPVVHGDATVFDLLQQAGSACARGFIAGTGNDLINIEIALTIRRHYPTARIVMRIFNDDLDLNLERSFGVNTAFSSSALGAPTLAVAAVSCSIAYVLPLQHTILGVSEVTIASESLVSGFYHTIETTYNIRILQWLKPDGTWGVPTSGLRLGGGDVMLCLGTIETLEQIDRNNYSHSKFAFIDPGNIPRPTPLINTVIVCGLGKVGYRVVKTLLMRAPRPNIVVLCDATTNQPFIEELQSQAVKVLIGDARVPDVLERAGIAQAYSIAAVTSDNLANIQIGLVARRLRADIDVVLRVFSAALAEQLDDIFGMYTAFSTSALAAPTLAAAAIEPSVHYALSIGGKLLTTMYFAAGTHLFATQTVGDITTRYHIIIVALYRAHNTHLHLPAPSITIEASDAIEVLADITMVASLRAIMP